MNAAQSKDSDPSVERGLHCRKCAYGRSRVIYTRSRPGGVVTRRRECLNCGARMTTWERAIGS